MMGVKIPSNTMKSNATAMRNVARFMVQEKYSIVYLAAPYVFYFTENLNLMTIL